MSDSWLKDIIGNAAFDALKDDLFAAPPEAPPAPSPVPEERNRRLEWMSSRLREIQRQRPGAKRRNHAAYLRSLAIEIGELAHGVEYWIIPNAMSEECGRLRLAEKDGKLPVGYCERLKTIMDMEGALNGYVAFNKRHSPLPVRDRGIGDGILAYVPVHGGITYINKDQTACVFGFDTAHYNSECYPRTEQEVDSVAVQGSLRRPRPCRED